MTFVRSSEAIAHWKSFDWLSSFLELQECNKTDKILNAGH